MTRGADDYIAKGVSNRCSWKCASRGRCPAPTPRWRKRLLAPATLDGEITALGQYHWRTSAAMKEVFDGLAAAVVDSGRDSPYGLLWARAATGKELIAKSSIISARRPQPMVRCLRRAGAELLESELFGRQKARAPGAHEPAIGLRAAKGARCSRIENVSARFGRAAPKLSCCAFLGGAHVRACRLEVRPSRRSCGDRPTRPESRKNSSKRDFRQTYSIGCGHGNLAAPCQRAQSALLAQNFLGEFARLRASRSRPLRPRRWTCCCATPGRATSASCAPLSSMRSS